MHWHNLALNWQFVAFACVFACAFALPARPVVVPAPDFRVWPCALWAHLSSSSHAVSVQESRFPCSFSLLAWLCSVVSVYCIIVFGLLTSVARGTHTGSSALCMRILLDYFYFWRAHVSRKTEIRKFAHSMHILSLLRTTSLITFSFWLRLGLLLMSCRVDLSTQSHSLSVLF